MINRRDFLSQSLSVVSLGASVPGVFGRAVVAAAEERAGQAGNGKTLVVVQLAGGVDGLNTVIPYRDPAYRQSRPNLGIREQDLLPLDDRIALHPSLTEFKSLFESGKLALIEGVGYPNPNFSHFKSMDIWQSADPDGGVARSGWLGRYFESLTDSGGHPLTGLSIGRSLPASLGSTKAAVPAIESIESFSLQAPAGIEGEKRTASLLRMYDGFRPAKARYAALLDTTLDSANQSSKDLASAHATYKPAVTYPQNSLATGLRMLAELIDSGKGGVSPLRVGHVTLGGFDTHTQQTPNLSRLLNEASESINAFLGDVDSHGHGDDVVVMTWSEFGRRVRENAQNGTDHGSAGPMFVMGKNVKGGFYGESPSLTNLDDGNMRYTTDFRSVYATLLERWLEAPAKDVLGKSFDQLGFL